MTDYVVTYSSWLLTHGDRTHHSSLQPGYSGRAQPIAVKDSFLLIQDIITHDGYLETFWPATTGHGYFPLVPSPVLSGCYQQRDSPQN